jgi:superfamily II DNA or RNA helicase
MSIVEIHQRNEAFVEIRTERSILQELSDYFSFYAPNYKFMPAFRNRLWDGKVRLFNLKNNLILAGLVPYIEKFCTDRDYSVIRNDTLISRELSDDTIDVFLTLLKTSFVPRDYQIEAFKHAVEQQRALLLSPTSSGKSFIIYLLSRFYNKKTLIITPTTSLVSQMASDFESYGYTEKVHKIYSGQEKDDPDAKIYCSTWQSIYKLPRSWFDKFEVVIGDEAHLFKAQSLTSIMEKLSNCKYRFGFTGTLDNIECNKLLLEGCFGLVKQVTTTSDLMDQGHVANLKIKALVLDYSDEEKKLAKIFSYQDEMDFLVRHNARNIFIQKLVKVLEGNTLILFQYVEKHGKLLKTLLEQTNKKVHYIDGSVSGDTREDIRAIVEKEYGSIIVASYGTMSTGVSIKNLHNVVFASPSKSRIRNLQSIGRGLRVSDTKSSCILFDIADDLSWKSKQNYTLLHFGERIKLYAKENFDYNITRVKL